MIQANIGKQAVLSKLLGVYAQAFEISLDYLYECYNNFVDMHRAVLSRQPELASKKWKEITAFKKIDHEDLAVICFIIADTIPTVTHTFYSYFQAQQANFGYGCASTENIIKTLQRSPPFYNIVRTASVSFKIKESYKVAKGEKIVFPVRFWSTRQPIGSDHLKYIFGDGAHACPGRGLVIPFVSYLLRVLKAPPEARYYFITKDDGNVYLLEDAIAC